MEKNLTGKADPSHYRLGRGRLYAAAIAAATGLPGPYRFLGNCPEFNITGTVETLQHFSSQSGLKVLDKEVVISQVLEASFKLDEWNSQNVALFFSGDDGTDHTNVAVAGFTVWVMVPDGTLELGRWYDIRNSLGNRAYDIDSTKLTVTTNEGSPVALVLNTDYELDAEMGRIFIKPTSTVAATAISGGKGLKVTLTADAGAKGVFNIETLTKTNVVVALKFISENPVDGDRQSEIQFHQISIKGDGDAAMISDEFGQLGFKGSAEKNTLLGGKTATIRTVKDA